MAIKWKNKYLVYLIALLLTLGLLALSQVRHYVTAGYRYAFNPSAFTERFSSLYVLDYLEKFDEETLEMKDISDEQVDNYRYRYGGLEDQLNDVVNQYAAEINRATKEKKATEKQHALDERNTKMAEIVANFTDSDIVRAKIIKETTLQIKNERAKELQNMQAIKKELELNYIYYLTDENGQEYKNIANVFPSMSLAKIKNNLAKEGTGDVLTIDEGIIGTTQLSNLWSHDETVRHLEGFVGMKKGSQAESDYLKENSKRTYLLIIAITAFAMVLGGLVMLVIYLKQEPQQSKGSRLIQKIPLDLRLLLFLALNFATALVLNSSFLLDTSIKVSLILGTASYLGAVVYLMVLKNLVLTIRQEGHTPTIQAQFKTSLLVRGQVAFQAWHRRLPLSGQLVSNSVLAILLGLAFLSLIGAVVSSFYTALALIVCMGLLIVAAMTIWHDKVLRLLNKPEIILLANEEQALTSNKLTAVEANLARMSELIVASKAHHLRNEELKTELLTNVSHDLRTPLTSIISYGELLTKPALKEKDRKEYTSIINQKALRMKSLIDDLFEVTKMTNGEITLNKTSINLGQLIQQSLAEYGDELAKKNLKVLYTKPSQPVLIKIDGDKMWRVFDNLIGNVVKYSMAQTRVYLRLDVLATTVRIQLKNISHHELNEAADNLVERFTRGDEARHTEGSGLGLAIANSIVNLHAGQLEIEVDGDMFKVAICLPLSNDEEEPAILRAD